MDRKKIQSKIFTPQMQYESEIVRNKFGIILDLTEFLKSNGTSISFYKISDAVSKHNLLYHTDSWNNVKKIAYAHKEPGKCLKFEDVIKTL